MRVDIMSTSSKQQQTTHFGFQDVPWEEKQDKVDAVFHSVADNYDIMNDLMSMGVHRLWKRKAVELCGIREGDKVLDLAGGSGDLTSLISAQVGEGHITLSDINASMLQTGRNRLLDEGKFRNISFLLANAECLPTEDNTFDCIIMAFGLRNVTDQMAALKSMLRVLKPGGRLVVLEFSRPTTSALQYWYDIYSLSILPWLGDVIASDAESYRYLAESIRKHPDQETLKGMMQDAGFEDTQYTNLTGGIVAIHRGFKY